MPVGAEMGATRRPSLPVMWDTWVLLDNTVLTFLREQGYVCSYRRGNTHNYKLFLFSMAEIFPPPLSPTHDLGVLKPSPTKYLSLTTMEVHQPQDQFTMRTGNHEETATFDCDSHKSHLIDQHKMLPMADQEVMR